MSETKEYWVVRYMHHGKAYYWGQRGWTDSRLHSQRWPCRESAVNGWASVIDEHRKGGVNGRHADDPTSVPGTWPYYATNILRIRLVRVRVNPAASPGAR